MEYVDVIIKIGALFTAMGVIMGVLIKYLKVKLIDPVTKKLDKLDREICKNYLTEFLADVKNGVRKNENQKARASELYDHYRNDLNGNSYIHAEWEHLMNGDD